MFIGSVTTKNVSAIRDDILIVSHLPGFPLTKLLFQCVAPYVGVAEWVDMNGVPILGGPGPFQAISCGYTYHPLAVPVPVLN
jgi:hypothetical protein